MTNDSHDNGVTDLLERATRWLTPDVARIIEHGTTRGRRTRRRHLASATVAAVAVLGGFAVVLPTLSGWVSGANPSDPSAASDPGPTRRHIAVSQDQFAQTLSTLLPGDDTRTDLAVEADSAGAVAGSLTWHGAQVSLRIDDTPDPITDNPEGTYGAGPSPSPRPAPTTARDWCLAMGSPGRCRELPNGDWASSSIGFDGDASNHAGWQTYFGLFTTDGYMVGAWASSLPDRGVDGREPVLTVPQLRTIAESDIWFTD
jgi:hypothetical protein